MPWCCGAGGRAAELAPAYNGAVDAVTTTSLAAAEDRLRTKVPAPAKVTQELTEAGPDIFVREIVVKPVPFVSVAVRQEFEVRATSDGGVRLCRAEYIKK